MKIEEIVWRYITQLEQDDVGIQRVGELLEEQPIPSMGMVTKGYDPTLGMHTKTLLVLDAPKLQLDGLYDPEEASSENDVVPDGEGQSRVRLTRRELEEHCVISMGRSREVKLYRLASSFPFRLFDKYSGHTSRTKSGPNDLMLLHKTRRVIVFNERRYDTLFTLLQDGFPHRIGGGALMIPSR